MKRFGWIALLLCAALALPGCGSKEPPKKTGGDKGTTKAEGGPLDIEVPGDTKGESSTKSEAKPAQPTTPAKPELKMPDEPKMPDVPKTPAETKPAMPDQSSAAPPAAGGGKLSGALGKAFVSGLSEKKDK